MSPKVVASTLLAFFFGSSVFANSDLSFVGFTVLKSNSSQITLKFQNENPFLISKVKFSSQADAEKFCKAHDLNLSKAGFDRALLLAISGAANLDKDIDNAITFKVGGESGVWAWTGEGNQIMALFDGHGTATEVFSADEFPDKALVQVSAICE